MANDTARCFSGSRTAPVCTIQTLAQDGIAGDAQVAEGPACGEGSKITHAMGRLLAARVILLRRGRYGNGAPNQGTSERSAYLAGVAVMGSR
jgi:hypothetical protein